MAEVGIAIAILGVGLMVSSALWRIYHALKDLHVMLAMRLTKETLPHD